MIVFKRDDQCITLADRLDFTKENQDALVSAVSQGLKSYEKTEGKSSARQFERTFISDIIKASASSSVWDTAKNMKQLIAASLAIMFKINQEYGEVFNFTDSSTAATGRYLPSFFGEKGSMLFRELAVVIQVENMDSSDINKIKEGLEGINVESNAEAKLLIDSFSEHLTAKEMELKEQAQAQAQLSM